MAPAAWTSGEGALNVVALNVVALNVVALNVVGLNVVGVNVVQPRQPDKQQNNGSKHAAEQRQQARR